MKLKIVSWKTEATLEVTPENPENRGSKKPEKTYKNRRSKIFGRRDFKSALSTYSNIAAYFYFQWKSRIVLWKPEVNLGGPSRKMKNGEQNCPGKSRFSGVYVMVIPFSDKTLQKELWGRFAPDEAEDAGGLDTRQGRQRCMAQSWPQRYWMVLSEKRISR